MKNKAATARATPGLAWSLANTLVAGELDAIAVPFSLDRFKEGRMIDESVAAAVAH